MAEPTLPEEVYATFVGKIDSDAVKRITAAFSNASLKGVKRIHLAFQSSGGVVGDGVFLYNFFAELPMDLIIYNSGGVSSIAVVAYLGAKKRKTSARACFMIHRTYNYPQSATAAQLKAMADSVALDNNRTEEILRKHLTLDDEVWSALDYRDIFFSARESVSCGIAHEVAEFMPPTGSLLYTV